MKLNKNNKLVWERITSKLDDKEKQFIKLDKKGMLLQSISGELRLYGLLIWAVYFAFSFTDLYDGSLVFFNDYSFLVFLGLIIFSAHLIPMLIDVLYYNEKKRKVTKDILGAP